MIIKSNILDAQDHIIVHQVNDRKCMGAGLALQIRLQYPQVYRTYLNSKCSVGDIELIAIAPDKYICNMYSQRGISRAHRTTDYTAMQQCLAKLNTFAKQHGYTIAIPYKLGCGLAGGDWSIVSSLLNKSLTSYNIYKL